MTRFQQSLAKLAMLVAGTALASLVLALFALLSTYLSGLWAFVCVALFAPLALACAVVAFKAALMWQSPASLSLESTGLVLKRAGTINSYAWDEIDHAEVLAAGNRSRAACIVLKEPRNGRRYISLGRFWDKAAEEIVEAVTEAKAQSFSRGIPSPS